jgi:hypothetical protein
LPRPERAACAAHEFVVCRLRRGELCGLTWTTVDLDSQTLTVAEQVVCVDDMIHVGPPKSLAGRRATEIESSGLRRRRVEGQTGVSPDVGQEVGSVLDALEPVAHDRGEVVDVGDGEVAQAAFDMRPDAFGGVRSGA